VWKYAKLFAAMSRSSLLILCFSLLVSGCSTFSKKESAVLPAGEKASVGPLVYSVIDTAVAAQLGDDPTTARNPKDRFYVMTISVSNSASEDLPIPGLTLVSDTGQEYNEVADGTDVPNWLGVVRRIGGAQTEQGNIVFDAPAQHYRLRLTDETDEKQLSIDVPLTFVHEELNGVPPEATPQLPEPPKK
jgi:hypothetical protein